jgi:hypothetical protein
MHDYGQTIFEDEPYEPWTPGDVTYERHEDQVDPCAGGENPTDGSGLPVWAYQAARNVGQDNSVRSDPSDRLSRAADVRQAASTQ